HFTPTRASWLNQIEIWFSILADQSLAGVSFNSVVQLRSHIDAFIEDYNEHAKPFAWTKSEVHQKRLIRGPVIPGTRRCAAAARQVPATDAPALRSAAYFPRASGARALRPRSCARRTSPSSAHARPSHCGVPGNSWSWRSPPSTIERTLVRSLGSHRDRHHKNALFTA